MPHSNKEERAAYGRMWRATHKEYLLAYHKRKREEMSEEEIEARREKHREYYWRRKNGLAEKRVKVQPVATPVVYKPSSKPGPKPMPLEQRMQRIAEKDAEAHALLAEYKKRAYDVLFANQNPYV